MVMALAYRYGQSGAFNSNVKKYRYSKSIFKTAKGYKGSSDSTAKSDSKCQMSEKKCTRKAGDATSSQFEPEHQAVSNNAPIRVSIP